jgi:hypothetical protein
MIYYSHEQRGVRRRSARAGASHRCAIEASVARAEGAARDEPRLRREIKFRGAKFYSARPLLFFTKVKNNNNLILKLTGESTQISRQMAGKQGKFTDIDPKILIK